MRMIGRANTLQEATATIAPHALLADDVLAEPYPSEAAPAKRKKGTAGPQVMTFLFLHPDKSRDGDTLAVGCYFTATGAVVLYDPPRPIHEEKRPGAYRVRREPRALAAAAAPAPAPAKARAARKAPAKKAPAKKATTKRGRA